MKSTLVRNPGGDRPRRRNRPEGRPASRTRRVLAVEALEPKSLLSGLAPSTGTPPPASGSFSALSNLAPTGAGTMMLETNGTVLMQGSGVSKAWSTLTPNGAGSYVGGAWASAASMGTQRLYFGSNVLPDGRVFVQGGEYSGASGAANDTNTGEIYDPVANTWTAIATFPRTQFGDDPTEVLPNGTVLSGYIVGPQTYAYNATANTWSATGTKLRGDQSDEESWVKLPDDSILSYDVFSSVNTGNGTAQRYIPSTGTWVNTGTVPVALSSSADGYELGPGFLLPDGRAFYLGANGNTAYYTPSTDSWAAGPVIPNGQGADDAPGAELPDGKILFMADKPLFGTGTSLYLFDPAAGTYTDVTSGVPAGAFATALTKSAAYESRMLMLPSGQVLMGNDRTTQLEVYTPGPATPASVPAISSVAANGAGTFTVTGTALNGISEGAAYGDDAEMSSNYPIINFTDSNGKVFFARTFGWTSRVAAVGSTAPVTTNFSLPAGLPVNSYQVRVIANGAASTPLNETNPTTVNPASASPNPDSGVTANLAVLGGDALGESSLAYTWSTTARPAGAPAPTFSANGTNAAKNDVVTFGQAGSYTFQVSFRNAVGLTTTSSVTVVVNQAVATLAISPKSATLASSATQQFTATATDQFGATFTPSASYSVTPKGAGGTIDQAGLYTAPASGSGTDTVVVSAGSLTDTATVTVQATNSGPPAVGDSGFESVAVGNGYAYDPAGSPWAFSGSQGSGSGVAGNSSGFTYANPNAPQGSQVAFLQANGTITQTVAGWAAGSYTISFDAARRAVYGGLEDFQVLVDGQPVGTFTPATTTYVPYTTASFAVAAGSHTIQFAGLDSAGGDNTAFLDAITVAVATLGTPTPGDPGFEAIPFGTGRYDYAPAGSPWAFSGSPGSGSGVTGNASPFTSGNPDAPQGSQVAFLQGTGTITQSIAGWAAGSYAIAFQAAQRGNYGASAEDFRVLIDGVVVGVFTPAGTSYRAYGTASFTVSAGTHVLRFLGVDSVGGDNTAFLDAVTIASA